MRGLVLLLFGLHLVCLAYLNNVYVAGLPVRSFLILLTGGLVLLADPGLPGRIRPVNLVYAVLAATGLLVSLANDVPLVSIANGELKLLQSYLTLVAAVYVLEQYGFRTLALLFVGIALPSALVGILQDIGVQAAWNLHASLSELQNKELSEASQMQIAEVLMRPPGLTLYAIPQTYMLLAGIMFSLYMVLVYREDIRVQLGMAALTGLFILAIFATETRSAMGAALFMPALFYLILYPARVLPTGALLLLLGVIGYVALGGNAEVDSRLVSLDDASAAGRATLYKYGAELFLRQPFGYGFNFDTVEYAVEYFVNSHNLFHYEPDEKAQYIVPVHNSILNLVHTYGFAGLLVLVHYVYQLVKGSWYRAVLVLGAFLNSIFHNAGILSNDLFMDMLLAVMVYEINRQPDTASRLARLSAAPTAKPPARRPLSG